MTDPNPKKIYGDAKPSVGLVPHAALEAAAAAHALGAEKYGPWNWRESPVEAMTYVHAVGRHWAAWKEGEDIDPESGASHLGHVIACCGILLDAQQFGSLIDNRAGKQNATDK